MLDFPWDYPDRFTVAVVADETGEATTYIAKHGGHGWLFEVKHGPQDKREGLPYWINEEGQWRAYAWTDAPPLPTPNIVP